MIMYCFTKPLFIEEHHTAYLTKNLLFKGWNVELILYLRAPKKFFV